jgi:hypothetical protein
VLYRRFFVFWAGVGGNNPTHLRGVVMLDKLVFQSNFFNSRYF